MSQQHIHFLTGRLAEKALRRQLDSLSIQIGFKYSIQVLPITVAALMSPSWIAERIDVPSDAQRVVIPGYCGGDLAPLKKKVSVPVDVGPNDLHNLGEFFGLGKSRAPSLDQYNTEIIAEINHAPRMDLESIIQQADALKKDGADVIDVGCEPGAVWSGVAETIKCLVERGHRVSIDSLNPVEITAAVGAGAELVLSVNKDNREFAIDWGCEVVAIPDEPSDLNSLDETVDYLQSQNVKMRLDPIIEPIGFGFVASLNRYIATRERWPSLPMMMGIGNLTELSDVDSSGVNFLLLAICQELEIRSVLTTQVINWCRSSVRECDLARRVAFHAIENHVPPKHLSNALVQLRDTRVPELDLELLNELARTIKDNNIRIFADGKKVHALTNDFHESAVDPFEVFDRLAATEPKNLNSSHAFYLGFEMCKAMIANQLGKNYNQDEALSWGLLTVEEKDRHRLSK